jgi:hypothetical protein
MSCVIRRSSEIRDARSAELDAQHERMMACLRKTEATDLEINPVEMMSRMMACLGKMEAMDLEVNPVEMISIAERQELPKEDAVMKSSGALMKRHRDWNLTAGRW